MEILLSSQAATRKRLWFDTECVIYLQCVCVYITGVLITSEWAKAKINKMYLSNLISLTFVKNKQKSNSFLPPSIHKNRRKCYLKQMVTNPQIPYKKVFTTTKPDVEHHVRCGWLESPEGVEAQRHHFCGSLICSPLIMEPMPI